MPETGGPGPRNRRWWLLLVLIMAVGLGVRLWYLFGWMHPAVVQGDPLYYHDAANLFADGRGWPDPYELRLNHRYVPDAQHPPLTSALLALPSLVGLTTFLEHQVFDCLLGTLTILVVALTGRRAAGPTAGLVAAGLAAVYPGMWINDPLLMSETTGILACSAVLWLAYRFWDRRGYLDAALLGLATAAAALARAELLLLSVFLVTPLVLLARAPGGPKEVRKWASFAPPAAPHPRNTEALPAARASWARRAGMLAAAGAACVLAIAPWAGYNLSRFNEPEYLSTGLGTTLAVTHCDTTYHGTFLGWWDFKCILKIQNEPTERSERDVFYRDAAYRYIGDHKAELPKVALARAGRTWGVFRPFQQVRFDTIESRPAGLSKAALFSLWVLLAAGAVGAVLLRRRRALLLPLLALPGALTVASTMVYGTSRFRAVAEPAVVLLAAVAFASIRARFVPRGRHSDSRVTARAGQAGQAPTRPRAETPAV
ncbi:MULTISPECIES: glycosyltransferase family 39 protein [unclassified Pseudofrankia]|uniref:glycosyltransferase family 39 protein n=1 Tax=unclassified Pseudofrankia TaxID=2994372 RepID=UPI001F51DCF0|nr:MULTISPECIES: glycosyltransferase family 39 protein [unclassified Pseudofrankia]MDT3438303.1 glycosyltransferase family 39 protein [Pseudofrankia sp. BMG5.37]